MKSRTARVVLGMCLALASSIGLAQSPAEDDEIQILLQKQIEIREQVLEQAREQFQAGLLHATQVAQIESQLLESRMELAREREREGGKGPLQRPIPKIELAAMDLGEVSRTLRDLLDGRVNFVLKDGAAELSVPALNLRGTDLLTLLNILSDIVPDLGIKVTVGSQVVPISPGPQPMGMMGGGFGMGDPFGAEAAQPIGLSENATVIFERTNLAPPPPRTTLTLFLGELLDEMELDDINTSIQTAWDLNQGATEPILRFHEDTDLLIVAGDTSHIQAAQEVINQLMDRRASIRNRAKTDMQTQYKHLQDELNQKFQMKQEKLSADAEKHLKAIDVKLALAERSEAEMTDRWKEAERAREELVAELKAVKQDHVAERARLLEKMEDELRVTRGKAFQERSQLLEQMDEMRRALDSQRHRVLDPAAAEEDPES